MRKSSGCAKSPGRRQSESLPSLSSRLGAPGPLRSRPPARLPPSRSSLGRGLRHWGTQGHSVSSPRDDTHVLGLLFGIWLLRDRVPVLLCYPCLSIREPLQRDLAAPRPCHVGVCLVIRGDHPPHLALRLHSAAGLVESCRPLPATGGVERCEGLNGRKQGLSEQSRTWVT